MVTLRLRTVPSTLNVVVVVVVRSNQVWANTLSTQWPSELKRRTPSFVSGGFQALPIFDILSSWVLTGSPLPFFQSPMPTFRMVSIPVSPSGKSWSWLLSKCMWWNNNFGACSQEKQWRGPMMMLIDQQTKTALRVASVVASKTQYFLHGWSPWLVLGPEPHNLSWSRCDCGRKHKKAMI